MVKTQSNNVDSFWVDVNNHWANQCLHELGLSRVFKGYPDKTFRPDNLMTRAEFAAALKQAFPDATKKREAIRFSDVSSNFWGFEAIRWAYERQFLSGYPGNLFKPQENIPRVQALVALASGLNLQANSQLINSFDQLFEDAADIPNYAKSAVAATLEKRIIASPNNIRKLSPHQPATRAEIAVFIAQSILPPGRIDRVDSQLIIEPLISPDFPPDNPWKNNKFERKLSSSVSKIAWSYNEDVIASYQTQRGIQFWDVKTGESIDTLPAYPYHTYLSFALNYSADLIAIYRYDYPNNQLILEVFDRSSRQSKILETIQFLTDSTPSKPSLTMLTFSPNGETLATFAGSIDPQRPDNGDINIWDVKQGKIIRNLTFNPPPLKYFLFSHNSELLASFNPQGKVVVWQVNTGKLLYTLDEETVIDSITFSLDSKFLLTAVLTEVGGFALFTSVRVWDMSTGMLRFNFDLSVDRTTSSRSFSTDGMTYFASGPVAGAKFFYVGNNQTYDFNFPPNISPMAIYEARQSVFSPQGNWLAIATFEGILIWSSSF